MKAAMGFHQCQNCDEIHRAADLLHIKDLSMRVSPGEVVPSGECPLCGALCHIADDPNILRVGDIVMWWGNSSDAKAEEAEIESLELVRPWQKEDGKPVEECEFSLLAQNRVIVNLTNGRWAYGSQIESIVGRTK